MFLIITAVLQRELIVDFRLVINIVSLVLTCSTGEFQLRLLGSVLNLD